MSFAVRCLGRRCAWLLLLCLPPAAVFAQEIEPFRVRNLNPLVAVFGLPVWELPPRQGQQTGVLLEGANHHRFSRREPHALMLDGETWRGSLFHQRRLGARWWLSLDVPYYQLTAGVLDGLIHGWHSVFQLPEGGRGQRARDQLLMRLEDSQGAFFHLDRRQRGLGDIQLAAGRAFGARDGLLLRASVTVPSGEEAMLAGSGGGDWAITVLRPRRGTFRERRAGFYWGMGVMRVSDPGPVAFDVRHWGYTAVLGGGWQLLPRAGIKAQLDLHSAFYHSPLREIGATAVHGTLGGWWRLTERALIEYGVSEDLIVGASPDVVLHAGVRFGL